MDRNLMGVFMKILLSFIATIFVLNANATYFIRPGQITSGMLGTLAFSGLTEDTSPDLTADFVPTFDASAGLNKKVKLANLVQRTIVSTGTTMTASASSPDQIIETTGSISINLYSLASTHNGYSVRIKKTDSSLFNLVKIIPASGEFIALSSGSKGTMWLSTPDDTVTLYGSGTLWRVLDRNCSMPMTLLGTTQISAVTTNPTKGTIAVAYTDANSVGKLDEVWIGRGGGPCNKASIRTAYYQSLGTGSATGAGDYITNIGVYTTGFSTSNATRNHLAGDAGQNTSENWAAGARFGLGQKGNCWAGSGSAGNTLIGSPVIWNGTMASSANAVINGFRCFGEDSGAGGVWGSGGYPITTDNMWFGSDFEAEMNNWSE